MRMGIGLLSLLIVVAIIAYVSSIDATAASKANKTVRQDMAPVTGRGPDDVPMDKSADFTTDPKGLMVTNVVAGGYYDQYFGLMKGDVITSAGDVDFKGQDESATTPQLWIMSQNKRDLTVLRAGKKVTLKVIVPAVTP